MKLQNHFTTIEQSKRLLELGVPANSADCYFNEYNTPKLLPMDFEEQEFVMKKIGMGYIAPCWSDGRLLEIIDVSFIGDREILSNVPIGGGLTIIENCVNLLGGYKDRGYIDFSKLEEML